MPTPPELRHRRKAAGWKELSCQISPQLSEIIEVQRGSMPRSQWLVQQVLTALGISDSLPLTWKRPGRPRTRLPTLPDLRVPLQHLTYRAVSLPRVLAGEIKERATVTLKEDQLGRTVLVFRKYTKFNGVEVYNKATEGRRGQWGVHFIPLINRNEYGVAMRDARRAEEVIKWVIDSGGEIVDERTAASRRYAGVVRSRPLVGQTDQEPLGWSLEIDIAASREQCDIHHVHRLLMNYWQWCPRMIGWFAVEEASDLLVSSGVTKESLNYIRHHLGVLGVTIEDSQPWGISSDPVVVEQDDLGLVYRVTANRQDRRCLVLPVAEPPEIKVSEWSDYRILFEDLGLEVREQLPAVPDLPDIDWSAIPGWEKPIISGQRLWEHQKEAVEFVIRNGFRCIIGDGMRVGKTVEAISSINVRGCRRIIAVVPATAQLGWRTMVRQWAVPSIDPLIIILNSTTEVPDLPSDPDRPVWVISTPDKLTPAGVSISLGAYKPDQIQDIADSFRAGGAEGALVGDRDKAGNLTRVTGISLKPDDDEILAAIEHLSLPSWFKEKDRIARNLPRVRGVVRAALEAWDPDAVVVDEAHSIKNPKAARTKTLRKLLRDNRRLALLTSGTITPNDYGEGLELLDAVVPLKEFRSRAKQQYMAEKDLAKTLLNKYMIHRSLPQVMCFMPKIVRERLEIPLGQEGQTYLGDYLAVLEQADEEIYKAIVSGDSEKKAAARAKALGLWEMAHRLLVEAKVADGFIAEAIKETVDGVESCAVFGIHLDAIATLEQQLTDLGIPTSKVVGGMSPAKIEKAISDFQTGETSVFLGSIAVAQGFSLDRTQVSYLLEMSYVPGQMGQCEARMMNQEKQGYAIRYCENAFDLSPHQDMDYIIRNILSRKIADLNELYDKEDTIRTTVTKMAGENTESHVRQYLLARAEARARERMEREGITPRENPAPKPKKSKGGD